MLDLNRIASSISRLDIANELSDFMDNTGRVAHFLISDSNGMHSDYGLLSGMTRALSASYPCFGTGLISPKHFRNKFTRGGGGGEWAWPFYGVSVAVTNAVQLKWSYTAGVWSEGSISLTQAGRLTSYVAREGDIFICTGGTNAAAGVYLIDFASTDAAAVAAGTIYLYDSIGASATTGISGYVCSSAGGSSHSGIAAAYAQGWNIPEIWAPHGASATHRATASSAFVGNHNHIVISKNGPLPANGILCASYCYLSETGAAFNIIGNEFDGTTGSNTLGNAAITPSGSAATYGVGRFSSSAADRVGPSSREFLIFATDSGGGTTGPISYLAAHVDNKSMSIGASMSGFLMMSGQSAYAVAQVIDFIDDATIDNYFKCLADQCLAACGGTGTRRACCWINLGFNDVADSRLDYNTGAAASYTAAGYVANITYIVTRLRARWDATFGAGTSATELYFAFMPSHPVSDSPTISPPFPIVTAADRQGYLNQYVAALQLYAATLPKAFVVDLYTLLGPTPYTNLNGKYLTFVKDSDVLHLSQAGYNYVAENVMRAMDAGRYQIYVRQQIRYVQRPRIEELPEWP